MKKQFIALIGVICLVLVVLLSFILYNQWPFMTGKKVVLATQPVDPFDPFRGQYMTINYEISRISDVEGFSEGDSVFISLKEDEQGIWRKESVSKSKPDKGDFIKGEVTSVYGNSIRIEYGIEQFFFERHAELPTRNITVEAIVANSGRAKLVQLLHNGEPIKIEYEKFDIKS
jgi:uncharacterized membrane-anchored protein